MVKISTIAGVLFLTVVLMSTLVGCSSSDNEKTITQPPDTDNLTENIVITIGNFTDKTGPGAVAFTLIDMALEDTARYYNEQEIITGVEFEMISYDGQFDPSRDIPGYEWLKARDADMIFTAIPSAPITLKPHVKNDELPLISLAPSREASDPPGYVFGTSTLSEEQSYSVLKWIAENDPDFPQDRPAVIGGAGWAHAYIQAVFQGAEEYAIAHPEQYEWEDGLLTNYTFTWGPEIDALKHCDYVIPPTMMNNFIKEFRAEDYPAQFIGAGIHTSFFDRLDKSQVWDEVDGMRIIMPSRWWNEEGEVVDFLKMLLNRYHPEEAQEIMRTSNGYLGGYGSYLMFKIVEATITEVGPENFTRQAFYETAQSFSLVVDGIETDSYSETKRNSRNSLAMYEFRAEGEDLFRITPDWIPVVRSP